MRLDGKGSISTGVGQGIGAAYARRFAQEGATVVEQYVQSIIDMQMAIHRALEPDDLTGAAVWLASDDSKMVTGQVIPVDGGMVMLG